MKLLNVEIGLVCVMLIIFKEPQFYPKVSSLCLWRIKYSGKKSSSNNKKAAAAVEKQQQQKAAAATTLLYYRLYRYHQKQQKSRTAAAAAAVILVSSSRNDLRLAPGKKVEKVGEKSPTRNERVKKRKSL